MNTGGQATSGTLTTHGAKDLRTALSTQHSVLSTASVASRGLTAGSRAVPVGHDVAKVTYKGGGVLVVPQSSLPEGYSVGNVGVVREGRAARALAVATEGLVLYAPGYEDEYTDKDAFFLTATNAPTAAGNIGTAAGLFNGAATTTSTATVSTQYYDLYFDWSRRPYAYPPWFSGKYLTDGTTQSFSVNLPDGLPVAGSVTVNVWSFEGEKEASPNHNLQAFVNGVPAGETNWDGESRLLTLTFSVPANAIASGANTIELRTPSLPGVESQLAMVHSISVGYTRTLRGPGVVELQAAGGAQIYEVAALPNGRVWVVDARDPSNASLVACETQAQGDGSLKARFSASAGKYVIVPASSALAPLSVSARVLKPVTPGIAYLATGPAQFASAIQPLLNWRAQEGISGVFVDQEEIFDYYGFGRYGPEPIHQAVLAMRPQYLLLVGRSTYDYRNWEGMNVDPLCPTYLASTTFFAQAPADALYGDLGNGYPEVAVGRLPANTPSELVEAVNHTLNYRGLAASGWRALITADRKDPAAGIFNEEAGRVAASAPDIAWSKAYLDVTYTDPAQITEAMRLAANGGADLIAYIGHGNSRVFGASAPRLLDQTSIQQWTGNVVLLPITCTTNWFVNNEPGYRSLPVQGLTQPQGGIAASIACTTYMLSEQNTHFYIELLKQAKAEGRWGQALLKSQQWAARQSGRGASWYQDLAWTQSILGDPALNVYTRSVQVAGAAPPPPSGTPVPETGSYANNPETAGGGTNAGNGGTGGGDGTQPGNTGGGTTPTAAALDVTRLTGHANFAATGKDACSISGALPNVADGTNLTGVKVSVNAGGATVEFTLDSSGKAKNSAGYFRMAPKAVNGARIFRAMLKGSFADAWKDEGVKAGTSAAIQMIVDVKLGETAYTASVPAQYVSKSARNGKFKK